MSSEITKRRTQAHKRQKAPVLQTQHSVADYAVGLVLALVPFHAFLTVWLSTFLGHYTLLRLWPEVLLFVLATTQLLTGRLAAAWRKLAVFRLAWPILLYLLLALLYFVVTVLRAKTGPKAASYGLLLDTRPALWFVVVYATVQGGGRWIYVHWQQLVLWPLFAVSVFALLQFFVLPPDWLHHFGYVKDVTITPIQTINQDTETIRAQSFLRGPNPLGAYLLLGICLTSIAMVPRWRRFGVAAIATVALFLSFSRSAWLGLLVTGVAWLAVTKGLVTGRKVVMTAALGLLILLFGGVFALQTNEGFKNAVLHVNDHSSAAQTSNEDRLAALASGLRDVLHEPLGRGTGTAGPASVYSNEGSRNSENYFLGLGQDLGWFGLGLFVVICARLAAALYRDKSALGHMLFAAFAGLTLVNMLSYAWTDVTLVYLWWGLAAMCLGSVRQPRNTEG